MPSFDKFGYKQGLKLDLADRGTEEWLLFYSI